MDSRRNRRKGKQKKNKDGQKIKGKAVPDYHVERAPLMSKLYLCVQLGPLLSFHAFFYIKKHYNLADAHLFLIFTDF